jgi:Glycosyltransferase like family
MKQVLLVTATKSKTLEEFQQRPLAKSLQVLSDIRYPDDTLFDFEIVKDNSVGLPEVYNRYLIEKNKDKIVLFVHDDLEIHDLNLVEKLNESPWDVTGLAGGSTYELKDKNLWHICSPRETHSGSVTHPFAQQQGSQIVVDQSRKLSTLFGPWPQRCLVLDGLFLAVNVDRALETGWRFDERHKFHHYDIASCLGANEKKLKMGTYPIFVVHHGLGNSFLTPEWEESNRIFKESWQNALKSN